MSHWLSTSSFLYQKFRPSDNIKKIDFEDFLIVDTNRIYRFASDVSKEDGMRMMIQWTGWRFFYVHFLNAMAINNHFHYCLYSIFPLLHCFLSVHSLRKRFSVSNINCFTVPYKIAAIFLFIRNDNYWRLLKLIEQICNHFFYQYQDIADTTHM